MINKIKLLKSVWRVLVPIAFFNLGLFVAMNVKNEELKELRIRKAINTQSINNCASGLETYADLLDVCKLGYNIAADCTTSKTCDVPKVTQALQQLKEKRIKLEAKLTELGTESGQIIEETNTLLQ